MTLNPIFRSPFTTFNSKINLKFYAEISCKELHLRINQGSYGDVSIQLRINLDNIFCDKYYIISESGAATFEIIFKDYVKENVKHSEFIDLNSHTYKSLFDYVMSLSTRIDNLTSFQ